MLSQRFVEWHGLRRDTVAGLNWVDLDCDLCNGEPGMNKAFVKESDDDDEDDLGPEAVRLPPGTKNYMTV